MPRRSLYEVCGAASQYAGGTVGGSYSDDGFMHLRAALDPALVSGWRPRILDAASQAVNMSEEEVVAVFRPGEVEADILDILLTPALGQIAARALGTSTIRLITGAAYIKPPGALPTFWHQDLWFFPIKDSAMITVWAPLA